MPTPSSHADQINSTLATICLRKLGTGEQIQASERLAKSHAWLMSVAKNYLLRSNDPVRALEEIGDCLDHLKAEPSHGGPALNKDWTRMSLPDCLKAHATACASTPEARAASAEESTTLLFYLTSQGFEGWHWASIRGQATLDREGADMRHCVGSYASDVASRKCSIYSLRDAQGVSRLTAEHILDGDGSLSQLRASRNKRCPKEWLPAATELASWWSKVYPLGEVGEAFGSPDNCVAIFEFGNVALGRPLSPNQKKIARTLLAERLALPKTTFTMHSHYISAALGASGDATFAAELSTGKGMIEDIFEPAFAKLLAHGHDAFIDDWLSHAKTLGQSPTSKASMLARALETAAEANQVKTVKHLLSLATFKQEHLNDALIAAAESGASETGLVLLPLAQPSAWMWKALTASMQKSPDLALSIMDAGGESACLAVIANCVWLKCTELGKLAMSRVDLQSASAQKMIDHAVTSGAGSGCPDAMALLAPLASIDAIQTAASITPDYGNAAMLEIICRGRGRLDGLYDALDIKIHQDDVRMIEALLPVAAQKDLERAFALPMSKQARSLIKSELDFLKSPHSKGPKI